MKRPRRKAKGRPDSPSLHPVVVVRVDGFDPANPAHVEVLERGVEKARKLWGGDQQGPDSQTVAP